MMVLLKFRLLINKNRAGEAQKLDLVKKIETKKAFCYAFTYQFIAADCPVKWR